VLGFRSGIPPDDIALMGKVFYTACIAVYSAEHPDAYLPPLQVFVPFLCELLVSGISERVFVGPLLDLLLRYANRCENIEDARCFVAVVTDRDTHEKLSEYLGDGYTDVNCLWEAQKGLAERHERSPEA
jgi:hypothetical protein